MAIALVHRRRHRPLVRSVAVVVAALVLGTSASSAAAEDVHRPASAPAATVTVQPGKTAQVLVGQDVSRVIAGSPSNGIATGGQFWRQDISKAPLDPRSPQMAAHVAQQVADHWGGVAAFNLHRFGTSTYTVPRSQARVDIKFSDCQGKKHVPKGLYGPGGHFVSVPIPPNALPAQGTDMHLAIWQPSTDTFWELWKAQKRSDGWYACWGGRIDGYSSSQAQFPGYFGVSASGIAAAPGSIRADEVAAQSIDHAMSLQIIRAKHWKTISWPAVRSDGWAEDEFAVAEGQRLRLDPSVNVDALKLHPVARAVAKAAQKYGFVVTDTAGAVAIVAENGDGVKAVTGKNPWDSLMKGTMQSATMKNFPWQKLQVLPMDYGKPGSAPSVATPATSKICTAE